MKPVVFLVGADKGGVGKTTIMRTLLDYLPTKGVPARAFDSEFPRGTLKRFFPKVTEMVDITTAADQMKVLDTPTTSDVKVSAVDVRAGALLNTLKTLTDVGFFDLCRAGEFNFVLFHVTDLRLPRLRRLPKSCRTLMAGIILLSRTSSMRPAFSIGIQKSSRAISNWSRTRWK
jgi:hypothetical protein